MKTKLVDQLKRLYHWTDTLQYWRALAIMVTVLLLLLSAVWALRAKDLKATRLEVKRQASGWTKLLLSLSDANKFTNGEPVLVDGGRTLYFYTTMSNGLGATWYQWKTNGQ